MFRGKRRVGNVLFYIPSVCRLCSNMKLFSFLFSCVYSFSPKTDLNLWIISRVANIHCHTIKNIPFFGIYVKNVFFRCFTNLLAHFFVIIIKLWINFHCKYQRFHKCHGENIQVTKKCIYIALDYGHHIPFAKVCIAHYIKYRDIIECV